MRSSNLLDKKMAFKAEPPSPKLPPKLEKVVKKVEIVEIPDIDEGCVAMQNGINLNEEVLVEKSQKITEEEEKNFVISEIVPQLEAINNYVEKCIPQNKQICTKVKMSLNLLSQMPPNLIESKKKIKTLDVLESMYQNISESNQCRFP